MDGMLSQEEINALLNGIDVYKRQLLYRAMHLKADRIFRETIPSRKKPVKKENVIWI